MQQQELAIRQQEVDVRKAKAAAEASVSMAKVQLEQEKIGGKLQARCNESRYANAKRQTQDCYTTTSKLA
jgi:type V secretory pathway adhesin AidA